MTIAEMNRRWKSVDTYEIGRAALLSKEDKVLEANKEQMLSGKTYEGGNIAPEYASESYANLKYEMNRSAGYSVPDLKYSGSFHNLMYISIVRKNEYKIFSGDTKAAMLINKYAKVMGLSDANVIRLQPEIHSEFITRLKKVIYG